MTNIQVDVDSETIDQLYKRDKLAAEDIGLNAHPNQYLTLVHLQHRVPCKVDREGKVLHPVKRKQEASGIKPRKGNEEQLMALDALLDDDIPVVVIYGRAGGGKTLLTLAAALQKKSDGKYDRIILTKPMVSVGNDIGHLPGTATEKLLPYLGNYASNLEEIVGQEVPDPQMVGMQLVPIQFIRGVSWANKFVIADEIQSLTCHEMLTLGTRVAKGTKLILMGDLAQRDRDILVQDTGLQNLVDHPLFRSSPLTAAINLTKVERSPVTELFTEIFS
jgi:PhoH-like ATPase